MNREMPQRWPVLSLGALAGAAARAASSACFSPLIPAVGFQHATWGSSLHLTSRSKSCRTRRGQGMPSNAYIDESDPMLVGTLLAGSGIVGVVAALRRASKKERPKLLKEKDVEELKDICREMRAGLVGGKTKKELLAAVRKALTQDDNHLNPKTAIGRIVDTIGQLTDEGQAADVLGMKFTNKDLQEVCKELRLPKTGSKKVLEERIIGQAKELLRARRPDPLSEHASAAPSSAKPSRGGRPDRGSGRGAVRERAGAAASAQSAQPVQDELAGVSSVVEPEVDILYPLKDGPAQWVPAESNAAAERFQAPSASRGASLEGAGEGATSAPAPSSSDDFVPTEAIMAKEEAVQNRRQLRMQERRKKLAGFLVEEMANTCGGEKDAPDSAQAHYAATLTTGPPSTEAIQTSREQVLGAELVAPEHKTWHSEPSQDSMELVGEVGPARQAWCRCWHKDQGCGEIVDLVNMDHVAVVSTALTTGANVSPTLKYLRKGEYVEFRRVDDKRTGKSRALLVRGLKGWPLMCEVEADDDANA